MSAQDEGYKIALKEAQECLAEGGIPVGGCVISSDGKILGRGRNMRIQNGSPILHGETAAFDQDRSLPSGSFKGSTLYTTMSCCPMCTGAAIWFGVAKVVIGDSVNYTGPEHLFRENGIEVVVLNTDECVNLAKEMVQGNSSTWQKVF